MKLKYDTAIEKIQVVDFRKLKPQDLMPLYNVSKAEIKDSMFFITIDGKVLLNKNDPGHEAVKMAFDLISKHPMKAIENLRKEYARKYPNIKEVCDIVNLKNNIERFEALILCLIPAECKRRKFECEYYEK